MNTIKMIGFDLDGTLLTTDKRLTERTKHALYEAWKEGMMILPATGRPKSGIPQEVVELPFVEYAITSNGARIVNVKTGETIFQKTLDREKAGKILDILGEYDTLREIYYDGVGYADEEKLQCVERYMENPAMRHYVSTTRVPVKCVVEKYESESRNMDKVQGLFANLEDCQKAGARIREAVDAEVTAALHNNVEIMEAGVDKGNAIRFMADKFGIAIAEVMTFGDGGNDKSMIEAAGIGVAMANGVEELRQVADLVAESNDEEGVAKVIETYILGRKEEKRC